MHTVYLLRHAKSSWSDPALSDRERPLAQRGRRDAGRIAAHLSRLAIEPQLVLCSVAERTRETLELILPALPASTVEVETALYGASAGLLLDRLRTLAESVASVMVIGHNPGLHDLALELASGGAELERLTAKFPTGALATLTTPGLWADLSRDRALLAAYVVPRSLS